LRCGRAAETPLKSAPVTLYGMKSSTGRRRSVALHVHPPVPDLTGLFSALEPGALRAPLRDVLATSCAQMARVLGADVVSVYVREIGGDEDVLTVQGNVGLSTEVVGNLRLAVGEGLVGWVAECLHPISVGAADADPRFKPVRGIGEELYPVMTAQPVVRHGRCLGVLVFQRAAAKAFTESEVHMASILAESIGLLLEAAVIHEGPARGDVGTEAVCLLGRPLSTGLGMGRVELIPTTESLSGQDAPAISRRQIGHGLARMERDLLRLRGRLGAPLDPLVERTLTRMELFLSDGRLRERALGAPGGNLATLARDYARASMGPASSSRAPDPVLVERAEGIGELCALLHAMATGSRLLQSGRIWIGRRLGPFFAAAAARYAAAVVLEGDGEATEEAQAIARAAGLPLLSGVRGLFAWTRPGDLLVVDADRGVVRVNPSSSGLVAARSRRGRRVAAGAAARDE
jgi:phosphotransferase system, enzyme I, PtsP